MVTLCYKFWKLKPYFLICPFFTDRRSFFCEWHKHFLYVTNFTRLNYNFTTKPIPEQTKDPSWSCVFDFLRESYRLRRSLRDSSNCSKASDLDISVLLATLPTDSLLLVSLSRRTCLREWVQWCPTTLLCFWTESIPSTSSTRPLVRPKRNPISGLSPGWVVMSYLLCYFLFRRAW